MQSKIEQPGPALGLFNIGEAVLTRALVEDAEQGPRIIAEPAYDVGETSVLVETAEGAERSRSVLSSLNNIDEVVLTSVDQKAEGAEQARSDEQRMMLVRNALDAGQRDQSIIAERLYDFGSTLR